MIDFDAEKESFADVVAKDSRYDSRAYVLLTVAIENLSGGGEHFSAFDILDEFKETALDEFGPATYAVMECWGLRRTEDIGNMMRNLVAAHRIEKDATDDYDEFANGYNFEEAFHGPYRV